MEQKIKESLIDQDKKCKLCHTSDWQEEGWNQIILVGIRGIGLPKSERKLRSLLQRVSVYQKEHLEANGI